MDSTTIIRVVAGILFAIGLAFLIQRRRKKSTLTGIAGAESTSGVDFA
jgi:LPXTG-motif cell wall-anchored protein